jgi:hypothetical protein
MIQQLALEVLRTIFVADDFPIQVENGFIKLKTVAIKFPCKTAKDFHIISNILVYALLSNDNQRITRPIKYRGC